MRDDGQRITVKWDWVPNRSRCISASRTVIPMRWMSGPATAPGYGINCSPSISGQWVFTPCVTVGRVTIYMFLYKVGTDPVGVDFAPGFIYRLKVKQVIDNWMTPYIFRILSLVKIRNYVPD